MEETVETKPFYNRITIISSEPGLMAAAAVKNRYGPADATGKTALWMDYFPANMQLKDLDS